MRNQFAESLAECALKDERIVVIVADISPGGSMEKFRSQFPHRFIDVGVSEQGMIGVAAGMALRGLRPFAYTIATFSAYRPFEMLRVDLCYQNLPVTVVGMGAGIIYSTLGGTHHAQEDVAVLSALPNMQIIAPCDPLEAASATQFCAVQNNGPVYLRIGKAGEPKLTTDALEPFVFGKLRYLRRGTDLCVVTYGHIMEMASKVANYFSEVGQSVSLVSCHTLKPLDHEGMVNLLHSHKRVIVMEEHSVVGGLAAQTKAIAWDSQAHCELKTFSLRDEFIHQYGSHADLQKAHGLSVELVIAGCG